MSLVPSLIAAAALAVLPVGQALAQAAPPAPPAPPAGHAAPAPPAPPAPLRFETADIQVRGVAAIVRVIPESRTDIAVSITNAGPLPAPEARRRGGRLVIEGGLQRKINRCRGERGDFAVNIDGHNWVAANRLPVVELRVPEHVSFAGDGAMRLFVGPAQSAGISLRACGEADFESVRDHGEFALAGGGMRLRVFDAGALAISIAGDGDVVLGVVRNGLDLSVAGGGDVNAARVDGPTSIALQGGGDVTIRAGYAQPLSIAMAGGGDVTHLGRASVLDAVLLGGGDVHVRQVEGAVNRRVLGGGDISVGR